MSQVTLDSNDQKSILAETWPEGSPDKSRLAADRQTIG